MPGQGRLGDKANVPLDAHGCPACPHPAVGPAIVGSPDVRVNRRPALRVGDSGIHAACCSSNTWKAQQGSATVFINNKAAFRLGDPTKHCGGMGQLIEGSPNVIVGDSGGGGGGATAGGGGTTSGGGGGGATAGGGGGSGGGGAGRAARDGGGGAGGNAAQSNVSATTNRAGSNGTAANATGATEAAQPVQVTVRVIGKSGEPVTATYGGTASGVVNGETQVTVPAGPFELELSDIKFADPIPAATDEDVPAARTFRRGPKQTFVSTAAEGAVIELQLERAVARLVEVTSFKGAVVLPEALPSLASCFRLVKSSADKVFVTGHGARSGDRARNARLYLTGPRDAWAEASAELLSADDEKAIATWAAAQPGWSAEGTATKETLGALFDLYDQSISMLLGVEDLRALRTAVNERLAYPPSSAPPAPPPSPDPLYKYGTDKPPRGGRADHYPFLRCTIDAQVYPSKLAKQATGDAADYLKSLDALNPHLCKNGQWSLVLHDEINLPQHYATGLRDFIAKEHYEIHLAPLEPVPTPAKDDNVVDCGQSHVQAPFEKAPGRRSHAREVEVVFVAESEVPEKGHVCGGASGACTVATCRLYDPRETELLYERISDFVMIELHDSEGRPMPGQPFRLTLPDGTVVEDVLGADGTFRVDDVQPGRCQVEFLGLASVRPLACVPPSSTLELRLHDGQRQPLSNGWYRLALDGQTETAFSEDGWVRKSLPKAALPPGGVLEWGSQGPDGPFTFRLELALDCMHEDEHKRMVGRLHNLGYDRAHPYDFNVHRFQRAYEIEDEVGLTDEGKLPPKTQQRLEQIYAALDARGGGAEVGESTLVGDGPVGQQGKTVLKSVAASRCPPRDPGLSHLPVRRLTRTQARDLAVYLHQLGELTLSPEPQFDGTCSTVKSPAVTAKVKFDNKVAGVEWLTATTVRRADSGAKGQRAAIAGIDLRNVVGIWHVTVFLRDWFAKRGCTLLEIHHIGIGPRNNPPKDAHDHGLAVDFRGVTFTDASGNARMIYMQDDWADHPVPSGDREPGGKPHEWKKSPRRPLAYRLDSAPGIDPLVRDFWRDLYSHVQEHYWDAMHDGVSGRRYGDAPTDIGGESMIRHADHPLLDPGGPSGRVAHANHFHFEIFPKALVSLSIAPVTLKMGKSQQPTVTGTFDDGSSEALPFAGVSSTDHGVATLVFLPNGVSVRAVGKGTADLKVDIDGVHASGSVVVEDP